MSHFAATRGPCVRAAASLRRPRGGAVAARALAPCRRAASSACRAASAAAAAAAQAEPARGAARAGARAAAAAAAVLVSGALGCAWRDDAACAGLLLDATLAPPVALPADVAGAAAAGAARAARAAAAGAGGWRRAWGALVRAFRALGRFVRLALRSVGITAFVGVLALGGPLLRLWGPGGQARLNRCIRRSFELGGGLFIKLGQWMSHRADFFPEDLCEELRGLRSRAPEHAMADTVAAFAEAFPGLALGDVFEAFPASPVASGSISQVYRARLRPEFAEARSAGGPPVADVAVKVQHPGVRRALADDLTLLRFWSSLLGAVPGLSWFRAPVPLDEFALVVQRQVDFVAEAAHLRRFADNFAGSPVRVVFPTPHSALVSRAFLVESWEEGTDIQEYIDRADPLNVVLGDLGYARCALCACGRPFGICVPPSPRHRDVYCPYVLSHAAYAQCTSAAPTRPPMCIGRVRSPIW